MTRRGRGCLLPAKDKDRRVIQGAWDIVLALGRGPDGKHKQKWIRFYGTKKDAQKRHTELLRSLDKNDFVAPSTKTFGEWLVEWRTKVVEPEKRKRTQKTYKTILDGRIIPALGTIRLQSLRGLDLRAYYATLTKDGLASATVRMHHAIISSALQAAVEDGHVTRNVAHRVKGLPPVGNSSERASRNVWTLDETRTFLAGAKAAGTQPAAFYALALDSGARKSELGGLRWSDINLETGEMSIQQQIVTEGDAPEFGPTKTGKPRTVALGSETVELLRKHKVNQAELKMKNRSTYRDFGLVFAKEWKEVRTNEDKLGQPLRLHNIGQVEFGSLINAAGVKRITFHGLRHTMATLWRP